MLTLTYSISLPNTTTVAAVSSQMNNIQSVQSSINTAYASYGVSPVPIATLPSITTTTTTTTTNKKKARVPSTRACLERASAPAGSSEPA